MVPSSTKLRIAIIGAGISGLTVARILDRDHEVTVFESSENIGGHAQTIEVENGGERVSVDAGVCMFYTSGYPRFLHLLRRLGIPTEVSKTSLEILSIPDERRYHFDLNAPWKTVAQSMFSQDQRWFVRDGFRFYRCAHRSLSPKGNSTVTIAEHFAEEKYSETFRVFLSFICGSIWTLNQRGVGELPMAFVAQSLMTLGFLPSFPHGKWHHIPGSVRRYLQALAAPLGNRIRPGSTVERVDRSGSTVTVHANGTEETFDHVVFAIPAHSALQMIAKPTNEESEILGAFSSQSHVIVVTGDTAAIRRWTAGNPAMFAATDVTQQSMEQGREFLFRVGFADINNLCRLPLATPIYMWYQFPDSPPLSHEYRRIPFSTPMFTKSSLQAQARHHEISGRDRLHFCGAGWTNGIHEGGVVSALNVTKWFGLNLDDIES
ncbi:MAG TPA: FAD-dependent oxidoreductase [Pirellulaceae bacterium]|nr:FAD-dependent oxidoreductase [Pirellulaceae bacterium]HMO90964.1 FAD-dependent oxidoreductase [Pirellulaceae bacterium]HMP69862.1 FAD-dependent oxidoreductase [Pirellulaceae bacterium]